MDPLTLVHVAAGGAGLLLAIPTTLAAKRRGLHTVTGRAFATCGIIVTLTALLLFARAPGELVGLGILGILTGIWSGGGWYVARFKPSLPGGWITWHVNLMGSAVIAFVTAFAVQLSGGHLAAWIAPTVIGSPIIARAIAGLGKETSAGQGSSVRQDELATAATPSGE